MKLSQHKRVILPAVLGVLACVVMIAAISAPVGRLSNDDSPLLTVSAAEARRHPLRGEIVVERYEELPQVLGVLIENAADAWPLSGLDEAFLVIEAPVEGDIPRFIAFFSEESDVDLIGPVRSARPYYVDWNAELSGIYAHVGGSPEALDLIASG